MPFSDCLISDQTLSFVQVVEDIMKKREPLGMLEAVYFIQPNEQVLLTLRFDSSFDNILYF